MTAAACRSGFSPTIPSTGAPRRAEARPTPRRKSPWKTRFSRFIRRASGFTLIELLVTLALISLFATMALPLAELAVKRNQEADLRIALRQIRDALDAYKQAADDGRVTIRPGDSGYPKTLGVLVEGVVDNKSPEKNILYFLRRIPRDPFADPALKPEDGWGKRSYKSPYDRPRPGDDVYDVYSLSTEAGINGVPYGEW